MGKPDFFRAHASDSVLLCMSSGKKGGLRKIARLSRLHELARNSISIFPAYLQSSVQSPSALRWDESVLAIAPYINHIPSILTTSAGKQSLLESALSTTMRSCFTPTWLRPSPPDCW